MKVYYLFLSCISLTGPTTAHTSNAEGGDLFSNHSMNNGNIDAMLKNCLLLVALVVVCAACTPVPEQPDTVVLIREDLVKSPNDERDYRYLELANGMKVLLISDPRADKSAASLSVYRGSFDDPEDRPGLAHFLEHMLFIGTEKYPETGGYFNYVQSNGGSSNAYTSSEHTNYFFDVQPEAFREGLDRFAHFFISPLFNPDYVEREKNAVQSEYQLQIKDDGWRGFAVQKVATNPAHPVSTFNIGSLGTLAGDVHAALLRFFEEHYSANQMGLVVLTPEPITETQPWVTELFSKVRNRNLANIERKGPVFLPDQLPAVLEYNNLKDTYTLSYMFPIPALKPHFREKPARYLANLIGHEGEGSLHRQLIKLGWINLLSAGQSVVDDRHALMSVTMELTGEGMKHIPEINGYLFSYFDMLRDGNVRGWLYEEQAMIAELGFRFAERSSAIGAVRSLSPTLEHYDAGDILVAPYLMEGFDEAVIEDFLAHLRPENALMSMAMPGFEGTSTEHWFGVSYTLTTGGDLPIAEVDASVLGIPPANPYLPESLELVEADDDIPLAVIDTAEAEIYVDTDLEFRVPRAVTHVSLRNPGGLVNLRNSSRAKLYAALVQDDLNALAYPALLAGVWYDIDAPPKGFRVSIGGYEDKQFVLLDEVLTRLINLDIRQDRFDVLKGEMLKDLHNQAKDKPFQQAFTRLQDELVSSAWTATDVIGVVGPLTLGELTQWRDNLFTEFSTQALIHGNVLDSKAAELKQLLARHVDLKAIAATGAEVARVAGHNEMVLEIDHDDATMVLYVQNESKSLQDRARSAFLSHLIAPGYFSTLRTDQQLGYVVAATHTVYFDHGGISFIIQSPVAHPDVLRQRTMSYMEGQVARLQDMSDEEFGTNKGGLITLLIQRDRNLGQRAQRYWNELDRGITTFDANRQLAEEVSALSKQDILEFLNQVLARLESDYLMILSEGKFAQAGQPG